jgi:hypothetical protein
MYRENEAEVAERRQKKQQWKMGCISVELTILRRHESGVYDDGHRYHTYPCGLELEMNSDQRAVSPLQTVVSVEVSDYIYKRLKRCNTVCIYYMPESPLTFLLEDEL